MRYLIAFLCAVLLSAFSTAQERFLVSPNQEVIPIPPGSSAQKLIAKYGKERKGAEVTDLCSGETIFGFDPAHFQISALFGFNHKDVMGEWFIAPARGRIDTFFFQPNGSIGLLDSLVIVRIFKSNLKEGHGPGYDYPAPCRSWGYWTNTNDLEGGIAAFIEDATDTNWHSTIESNGGAKPSFEPFGSSVWGMSGVPIKLKPNAVNAIPMNLIPGGFQIKPHSPGVKDSIDMGEAFFFSMQMNPLPPSGTYPDPVQTQFAASYNGPFPARDWKFYEHDSGPSPTCSGTPAWGVKKGWVARGPLGSTDTLASSAFNVWYVMTATSNVPPRINWIDRLEYTLSTESRTINTDIFDCDAENLSHAGVESVYVRYTFSDLTGAILVSGSAPLEYLGGDTYSWTAPGAAKNTVVKYRFYYSDSTGLIDSSAEFRYRVVDLNSQYYRADTTLPGKPASIAGVDSVIHASQWFLPPGSTNTHRADDGTAGPFSLGGPFVYFGDTMNYAWVGVNGAIALSKTTAETLDVNANGLSTDSWDLPQRQYHGRTDVSGQDAGLMPKNFIAPFWANWIVQQDEPKATFGHVRYSSTADSGKFIVEWDSLGNFVDPAIAGTPDHDVFRAVLDRPSGTIQFQYDDVGEAGLDMLNLTGIQSDSLTHTGPVTAFNLFNRGGFPSETHLHNGLCVTYSPCAYGVTFGAGWNLVSVGVRPPSLSTAFLFPEAAFGNAFSYDGSYHPIKTLATGGGYWVKFNDPQTICIPGTPVSCIDDTLVPGWNIVGSLSKPVPVISLCIDPFGCSMLSPFFGFSGSYYVATVLNPGHAYWVKASAPVVLHMCAAGAVPKQAPAIDELAGLDKVTIQDKLGRVQTLYIGSDQIMSAQAAGKYEMPPVAPDETMVVRFASGRMVEVYPSELEEGKQYEYPISMQGCVYPLVVKWEAGQGGKHKLALIAATGKVEKMLGVVEGKGKVTITDAAAKKLILKLTEGLALPRVFALSQNYPNPFNPTTHFNVDIPRASAVDITLYDVLGRTITTLMTGEQEAGYHIVEWDSKDSHGLTVPSGMYMVRMTAGEFSAITKIVLMK